MEFLGLRCWEGALRHMKGAHVHAEIELNLLLQGETVYLFGGRLVRVRAGELALFWAALPHQIIEIAPETRLFWATLPLPVLLGFGIAPLSKALLRGDWLQSEAQLNLDAARFAAWQDDLARGDEAIALLEIEARLRRFARGISDASTEPTGIRAFVTRAELGHIEAMAAFIAENYARDIALPDIAGAVNLNTNYASTLFKREFGATLGDYLLRTRLAHAQRLLVSGDRKIGEVGLLSGFGSPARFHAAFKEKIGVSPRAYRVANQI